MKNLLFVLRSNQLIDTQTYHHLTDHFILMFITFIIDFVNHRIEIIIETTIQMIFGDLDDSEPFDHASAVINERFLSNVHYDINDIEKRCLRDVGSFIYGIYENAYEPQLFSIIYGYYVDLVYENLITLYLKGGKIKWTDIAIKLTLSDKFIETFKDKVDWHSISWYQPSPETFIRKNINRVRMDGIFMSQKLSDQFIIDFINHKVGSYDDELIDTDIMPLILSEQQLSESFLEKYILDRNSRFRTKENMFTISKYQKLSNEFIDKHAHDLNWDSLSSHQDLSLECIEKYRERVNWNHIFNHQKLPKEFVSKHHNQYIYFYVFD